MDSKHEGLPVAGYRPQSEQSVAEVNYNKELEERVLRQIDRLTPKGPGVVSVDPRWLAIARTNIELGFMALNRAVFQPGRVSLPEDAE